MCLVAAFAAAAEEGQDDLLTPTAVTGTTRRDSLDDLRSLLRSLVRAAKGHWKLVGTHGIPLTTTAMQRRSRMPDIPGHWQRLTF